MKNILKQLDEEKKIVLNDKEADTNQVQYTVEAAFEDYSIIFQDHFETSIKAFLA